MTSTENEEVYPILIALMVVAVLIYCLGVYFHVKIIQASRKDKDVTWKLDIANSIILLFNFFQSMFMHTTTFIVKDLYLYTGEWFCYLFKVIANYTTFYMYGHAFIISLTKYTIIVHWKAAREWGNEKVAMLYFWINFTHPTISILIWLCIRPDFFEYSQYEWRIAHWNTADVEKWTSYGSKQTTRGACVGVAANEA